LTNGCPIPLTGKKAVSTITSDRIKMTAGVGRCFLISDRYVSLEG
jgi:hypothetical protein